MEKNKDIYFFSGTHWDREWYQTFQAFRYRLTEMADGLLEGMENVPGFNVFHFDGQTIVLEDYAEIEPENAEKLKKYIAEDRIKIGPWYVMPDEFNLSGESLIRNLMLGHELSKKWGAKEAWKFGYVCDIFGHIAQLPQIFNSFGIRYSLQCRGYYGDSQPYFIWQSPDGSECLNFRMGNRYGYGEFCLEVLDQARVQGAETAEDIRPILEEYMKYLFTTSDIPVYVVMDALDHREMHYDTPKYIKMIEEIFPDARVHHVDLLEAGKQLEQYRSQMEVVKGELNKTNNGGFPHVITNTLSSYYTLKKANDRCQNRLEKIIEPILVYASMAGLKLNRNYLKLAYKYLIQNHPHDSICGCSIEQVHKDMEYRFDQTQELCDVLEENYLLKTSRPCIKAENKETDAILTLHNTLPFERDEVVTVRLNMKRNYPTQYAEPFGYEFINSFKLIGFDGKEIPYQIKEIRNNRINHIEKDINERADIYRITFRAKVPAGGKSEYRIVESEKPSRYLKHMESGADYMENEYIRIEINPNGTISMLDKKTNKIYNNQLSLADNSEIGDGWYHADAKEDTTVYSAFGGCRVEKTESGCSRCVFRITKEISLPRKMIIDNITQRRSSDYEKCEAVFEIGLSENARYAEVNMTFDNKVRDHRLRLAMPTYTDGDMYFAGQAFYCCTRKAGIDYSTQDWIEPEQYEKAMNGIVGRRNGDGSGLAFVSAEGLHECGSTADKNSTLYITLLRGFEKAVHTDGQERGQLNGKLQYRFILAPLDDTVSYSDLLNLQDILATELISTYREVEKNEKLAVPESSFRLDGENIHLSVIKCAEREEGAYTVRVFNASDKVSDAVMKFNRPVQWVKNVNLNEEEIGENTAKVSGSSVSVPVNAWQIVTVMVKI